MKRILIYEKKSYLFNKIKIALKNTESKIYETTNYNQLSTFLKLESLNIDIFITELNFINNYELELISKYLKKHPHMIFIVFADKLTKKTFLDVIKIGATDYILNSINDTELKIRLLKHLDKNNFYSFPINIILDLKKYISGEIEKANKGNYKLTITFSTMHDSNNNFTKKDQTLITTYFSNKYWNTDSLVTYGINHFLSFFPFCKQETIANVEKKLQNIFMTIKINNTHMNNFTLHNTYVTFPEEGISLDDILKIVERKLMK